MGPSYPRVANSLFGHPHLYDVRKAEELLDGIGQRVLGQNVFVVNGLGPTEHVAFERGRPSAGVVGDRLGRSFDRHGIAPFEIVDGVAIIAVEGTLIQKGAWIGSSSGDTSYQGLQVQVARAARNKEVRGVAFEIDSFGGMVNGAFEVASAIRELSKLKPTIAILSDFAYSAGYLLASQARQIIVPEDGGVGSIGVVMMHADHSGKFEKDGVKVTFIHSGAKKVDGNPYQALPAELRDKWKGQVDAGRDRFAAAVGQGRGKRFSKASALKTEAATYSPKEAVEMGLADAIGDSTAAFDAFIREIKRT